MRSGRRRAKPDCPWHASILATRARIPIPQLEIEGSCRRNHIRRLSLFGSVLRDDFTPDSDVDVLVEFEPGALPGFAFFGLRDELSEILGLQVDLNAPDCLSKYLRDPILADLLVVDTAGGT